MDGKNHLMQHMPVSQHPMPVWLGRPAPACTAVPAPAPASASRTEDGCHKESARGARGVSWCVCLGLFCASLQAKPITSVSGKEPCPTEVNTLWQQLWLVPGKVVTGEVSDVSTFVQGLLVRLNVVQVATDVVLGCKEVPPSINAVLQTPQAEADDADLAEAWTAAGFKTSLLAPASVLARALDREDLVLDHWHRHGLWNSLGPSAAGVKMLDEQRTDVVVEPSVAQSGRKFGA